jgi:hypothetical protein
MRSAEVSEPRRPGCRRQCGFALWLTGMFIFLSSAVLAQQPDSQDGASDSRWSATTDSKEEYANPTRTIQTHVQNGNRTIDVRSLQTRGADGNLNPYQDIETETVRLSSTTTRTTTRTFVRDGNGAKTLFQVTEEEQKALAGGGSKVVRTTSNPDANGNLQIVQRENQDTVKTSSNVELKKTTVLLPSINGGLAPAMQIEESQRHSGNTVDILKTTELPDGAGNWQVAEVRHVITKDKDKDRSSEERVSRTDLDGKLAEVTHTVGKESEDASGDKQKTQETYSIDQPGATRDGGLHLVQRVTTVQRSSAHGQQTTKAVEQTNPGDPGAGLWVTIVSKETARLGPAGVEETSTIQLRDADGNLGVIAVDMTKADSAQAIKVQIAPSKTK